MLTEVIGLPAMLEQTAEECVELAKACLKMARYIRDENKVYGKSEYELKLDISEEMADVLICMVEIMDTDITSDEEVSQWMAQKKDRMKERLKEDNNGNQK